MPLTLTLDLISVLIFSTEKPLIEQKNVYNHNPTSSCIQPEPTTHQPQCPLKVGHAACLDPFVPWREPAPVFTVLRLVLHSPLPPLKRVQQRQQCHNSWRSNISSFRSSVLHLPKSQMFSSSEGPSGQCRGTAPSRAAGRDFTLRGRSGVSGRSRP